MTGWDCPEASVSPPGQKLMVAPPSPSDHPGVRALGLEADPPRSSLQRLGFFHPPPSQPRWVPCLTPAYPGPRSRLLVTVE